MHAIKRLGATTHALLAKLLSDMLICVRSSYYVARNMSDVDTQHNSGLTSHVSADTPTGSITHGARCICSAVGGMGATGMGATCVGPTGCTMTGCAG